MLLAIVITNLILMVIPLCLGCLVLGYAFRGIRLSKFRNLIEELEKEMLQNHAEILALQKENTELADKLKNNPVPVIPITGTTKEPSAENLPDVSARKKLLSTTNKHS